MGRYTIRCEGLAYETSRDDLTNFFGGRIERHLKK